MKQSKAKYKVYLHQNTFIINKNFIFDILNIFNKYPQKGIMGMIGAVKIPFNRMWSSSKSVMPPVVKTQI